MNVIPLAKPASMPMLPIEERAIEVKKKFAYFLFLGKIYYGECVDADGFVFDNLEEVKGEDDKSLRVDNFFVFENKVWYATRFDLMMGNLDSDGKVVRNIIVVQGIPKQTDIEYYHILRCCIGEISGYFKMFTEEALMEKKGVGAAGMNYHSRICEYTSNDLLNWRFQRVLYESDEIDSNTRDKEGHRYTKDQEMKIFRFYSIEIRDLNGILQRNIEDYGTDFVLIDKEFRAYIWIYENTHCYQSDNGVTWRSAGALSFLTKPWTDVKFLCWGN